jgi:plastocyanin
MSKKRFLALATVGVALALPASAAASGAHIEVQDVCDEATFNAVLGDGACERPQGDGGGNVTFDELIARLERKQEHKAWRFKEDKVRIEHGEALTIAMTRGGEAHTITEVPSFGLGCVEELNALTFPGQDPSALPAVCANPLVFTPGAFQPGGQLILPRHTFSYTGLSKGVHRFMCMIHPWMKTTVTVR